MAGCPGLRLGSDPMFVPVLLGSDINVYGMARSFHERYGVRSLALTTFPLVPIRNSSIIDIEVFPGLADSDGFVQAVREVGERYLGTDTKPLLVACGDGYATLVARHKDEVERYFTVASVDAPLLEQLLDKERFYQLCAQHGLDHPQTYVLHHGKHEQELEAELPFSFPVVLKPTDTVAFARCEFPGKKKAYVLQTQEQLHTEVAKIYAADYRAALIVQEYIPGGDGNMRVLNGYVSRHGKVQLLCLGNPLLEDHSPELIGNYTAIIDDSNAEVYERIGTFLEAIGYTGFANLDLKYDVRDQKYKLLELNPRQGRSSYFVTLAGYNLAEFLVEDRVYQRDRSDVVLGSRESLWLGIPKQILLRYAEDSPAKRRAVALINKGKYGSTLFYRKDRHPLRLARLAVMYVRYFENYRRNYRLHAAEVPVDLAAP